MKKTKNKRNQEKIVESDESVDISELENIKKQLIDLENQLEVAH